MTVAKRELDAAKAYMRVGDEDDEVVRACYAAAKIYLSNTGIEKPNEDSALYNLALWGLCLHYYDHRDAVGNEAAIPNGLRPILNQLKQLAELPFELNI